jgi:hypothetical protein
MAPGMVWSATVLFGALAREADPNSTAQAAAPDSSPAAASRARVPALMPRSMPVRAVAAGH